METFARSADVAMSWPDSSHLGKARHYDAGSGLAVWRKHPESLRKSAFGVRASVPHPVLDTPDQSR